MIYEVHVQGAHSNHLHFFKGAQVDLFAIYAVTKNGPVNKRHFFCSLPIELILNTGHDNLHFMLFQEAQDVRRTLYNVHQPLQFEIAVVSIPNPLYQIIPKIIAALDWKLISVASMLFEEPFFNKFKFTPACGCTIYSFQFLKNC